MNHYDQNNILDLCSQSHRLASSLAKKLGMDQGEIEEAQHGLRLMADKVSKALCNRPLYTVTIARCLDDGAVKHENTLTTPIIDEALHLRNDINQDSPLYGAKRIAQIVKREVKPRKWELWTQSSDTEIHLRCQVTNARALLRSAAPEILTKLYCGKTLVHDRSIYLQSESVEVTVDFTSIRRVKVTEGGGRIVTHDVKVSAPTIIDLDVNESAELTIDARGGVVAKFPIEEGSVTLPGHLAKALKYEGIALPLRDCGHGKTRLKLTSQELLTRLELTRVRKKRRSDSRLLRPAFYTEELLAA